MELNKSEIVNVKHVISASSHPVSVNLFEGVLTESIIVTNSNGDEKQFGLSDDGRKYIYNNFSFRVRYNY